jgi:antitoxin MazE
METLIQKWGNSLALRIPNNYAKDIHLKKGSHVNLVIENNKIVVSPKKENIKLKALLSKIDKNNLHSEEVSGESVGKEVW